MYHASPEEALRHPTWSMGPKVTIDSATLMNKALEIIEAHWLFGLQAQRIGVLIHPQSIVHAMVETSDGGVIAQLAAPDMRGPIHHALSWPARTGGPARRLNWNELGRLEFRPPRGACARAIDLGLDAIRGGGTSGAILNAANEAAVAAFLARRMPLGRIVELTAEAVCRVTPGPLDTVADAMAAADETRRFVATVLGA
jgi:1-deoxy-D-xylulose-5-phosphate reductoisomerase